MLYGVCCYEQTSLLLPSVANTAPLELCSVDMQSRARGTAKDPFNSNQCNITGN